MAERLTEYVESGCMEVRGHEDVVLKAMLGSCVGVVLVDRNAGVGGMQHLILPEPSVPDSCWNPEIYATSGLPLFISAMKAEGASPSGIEAYVAGGALMGSVSDQDLALDIGGRTADAVTGILKDNGIIVRQAETGGLSNMAMCLDLKNMECSIELLVPERSHEKVEWKRPGDREFLQALAHIRPVPQVALKIIRMMDSDNYNMSDIAEEVRKDQVIAARVLQLTNSAMTGWPEQVDSVDEALMILGEKKILRLIVSASFEMFYTETETGYSRCKGTMYHHAIGVAMAAEHIARKTGKSDPAVAYTAGLLHDIGKVVLDHFVARSFPLFYRKTYEDRLNLEDAEKEILGISHSRAGEILARSWSIPLDLVDAIKCHHRPDEAVADPDLANIVYIADSLLYRFSAEQSLGLQEADMLLPNMEKLGLGPADLPSVIENIKWDVLNSLRM